MLRIELRSSHRFSAVGAGPRLRRFGGRGDVRAEHDGKLGGSPTWRCPKPALHLAPAGGPGGADGRWQRRRGRTGIRLPSLAQSQVRELQRLLGKKTLARSSRKRSNTPRGQKNGCGCRRCCRVRSDCVQLCRQAPDDLLLLLVMVRALVPLRSTPRARKPAAGSCPPSGLRRGDRQRGFRWRCGRARRTPKSG
jgi:hypothetical protein